MDAEELRARRERREQSLRRRRALALGALAAVAIAAIATIALASGGGGSSPRTARARSKHTAATAAHGKPAAAGISTTPAGPPGDEAVPILMYHVIAAPPAGAPFPGLYVEPAEFAAQMQALKDAGWHAVTPDQVESYWRGGTPPRPAKPDLAALPN